MSLQSRSTVTVKAHLDYGIRPCDIEHMTIWSLFEKGLGPLKKISPPYPLPRYPPPDIVWGVLPIIKSDQTVMCPISHGFVMYS